ncbi:unnamed protein product [Toxocara canis]|uniref:Uncharacterized protein n=1 Tax=Toxocara canis TaxID=6265 RepID=A0A183U105_TOXCA|nr:unnamed protein product [Toxocara canis]
MLSFSDQSVLKYRNFRDLASPTPSYHGSRKWYLSPLQNQRYCNENHITWLRDDASPLNSGAWTPTPRFGSRPESRLEYECLPPRRSKSVGRYVDSTLHNDEDIVERWREERARLSSRSTTSPQQSPSSAQATSAAVHANGVSSCGASPITHDCNNRFALERSKTAHFHLPTYRFRDEDARPIPALTLNCMRCGRLRRELSWREIEFLYDCLGKNGVHRESVNEDLNGRISNAMIRERLEETCRQLESFLESLEGRRRTYSLPQLSTIPIASNVIENNALLTECKPSTSKGDNRLYSIEKADFSGYCQSPLIYK